MAEFQCNEIEIKPGIQINSLSDKELFKIQGLKTNNTTSHFKGLDNRQCCRKNISTLLIF